MPVRALSGPLNKSATKRIPVVARNRAFQTPSPTGGWNARDQFADMPETDAIILDNWFPAETSVGIRRGHASHVTGVTYSIDSLMAWSGPSGSKLFAAAHGSIFDVTSPGVVGAAAQSGLLADRWSHTMFGTGASNYLYCVNGRDAVRYFDGTSWSQPAITGTTSSEFSFVNLFKQRLFFLKGNALSFWYLDVSSIAGSAVEFNVAPYCALGGYLVAMGTWTRDGGAGIDDFAIFVTSRGEVLIFQGTDPGDASGWSMVGVFRIGPPLGNRCMVKLGSDLIIITRDGFSQLSRFLAGGRSSSKLALSDKISGAVVAAVQAFADRDGWQPMFYPTGNMVLVNVPVTTGAHQYVSNSTTGAWCRFTGMDARCWEIMDDQLFFGGLGTVFLADTGLDDNGASITADIKPAFSFFGDKARLKRFAMVRPNLVVDGAVAATMDAKVDFEEGVPTDVPSFSPATGANWGTAEWDSADWGDAAAFNKNWTAINGLGRIATYRLRTVSSNGTVKLNSSDWLMEYANGFV